MRQVLSLELSGLLFALCACYSQAQPAQVWSGGPWNSPAPPQWGGPATSPMQQMPQWFSSQWNIGGSQLSVGGSQWNSAVVGEGSQGWGMNTPSAMDCQVCFDYPVYIHSSLSFA